MDLRHFVEEMGLLFEYAGIPRMAGRIFSHLLLSEPPQQSAEEISRAIQASRASVSTMTRLLIQGGLVERQVLPGKRHDTFRIRPDAFRRQLMERVRLLTMFREVAERGLEALNGERSLRAEQLKEMVGLYRWMEREFPRLIERYQRESTPARRRSGPP